MDYGLLTLHVYNGIATITLDRPKVLNALNWDLVTEIESAARELHGDERVRAVVIAGSGGNFAAGADIGPMAEREPVEAKMYTFNSAFNALEDLPVPVIAAVSGYALGGGLELALACDFRICSSDAKLGMPEIKLAIFPGAGGTQRLPKLIGLSRAKMMIFLGETVNAATALEWGLCDKVVEGDPVPEAMALAGKLAERAPVALCAAKRAVNHGFYRGLREGIYFEEDSWAALFSTEDQKEGMRAFMEKRKPVFRGK
ncbi:MAG: enoyl-CoA hydratase/isomerase family protein [Spirochaetes bacterium]|nr:enoyl-CoA hydratase/isomerase family protein [Spirochaetota bacterium]